MNDYHFPVTPEEDRIIRAEVAEKLRKLSDDNFESWIKDVPGLKGKSGRERLLDYQEAGEAYWLDIFSTYPQDLGRAMIFDWANLLTQYPEMGLIPPRVTQEPLV